jgi:hypothetical protein
MKGEGGGVPSPRTYRKFARKLPRSAVPGPGRQPGGNTSSRPAAGPRHSFMNESGGPAHCLSSFCRSLALNEMLPVDTTATPFGLSRRLGFWDATSTCSHSPHMAFRSHLISGCWARISQISMLPSSRGPTPPSRCQPSPPSLPPCHRPVTNLHLPPPTQPPNI